MMLLTHLVLTLHILMIVQGSSQNNCPRETTQAADFLRLVREVSSSKEEEYMGDTMLPICSRLTRKPAFQEEPQEFQKVANKDLFVFSAFVERRPEADGPAIRIIGSGLQERFNRVGRHYCQLWYPDLTHPISVGPALYQVIYPSILHGDMWVSHFLICKLPDGYQDLPYAVSVTGTRCEVATNELMVLSREQPNVTDTHGLCISPMYNYYSEWELLMEQIELHKLLGAAEITLYKFSVNPDTEKVLQSYTEDPEANVNLVKWDFPVRIAMKTNVWCQRAALNDCIYRMSHRHKYVTITDMDEILVPRKDESWPALMHRLHTKAPSTGAFLFQHAYFRRNTSSESPFLVTQSSFWRTHEVTPPGKIRSKAMYEAAKAVSIDLHFPYSIVPSATELILDPEDGMLHHYRPYPMEGFKKHPEKYTFIEDRHMEIYKESLAENVKRRLARVDFD